MTNMSKTTASNKQNDLPELQGQSDEFKEAVRKSLNNSNR
jgi:hypothetical protein